MVTQKFKNFCKGLVAYLKNVILLPARVRWLRFAVPALSKDLDGISQKLSSHRGRENTLGRIFSTLDDVDHERPTFLVSISHFRMLRYIEPLLNTAQADGYQIVVLYSPQLSTDSEQFKITKYIRRYKIIHLTPFESKPEKNNVDEYTFSFYAFLYNCNIKAALFEELHHYPLFRFGSNIPYIKERMPLMIAFKHNFLFQDYFGASLLRTQTRVLKAYCDLYFVWGDLHKKILSHLPPDKIVSAGWNALDHLKTVQTSSCKRVFLASGPSWAKKRGIGLQVVEELLYSTDFEVYVKSHPSPGEKIVYPPHDRLHILGDFDDYMPILASCAFSLSYASNICLESWCLKKPHIILPSQNSENRIFDPLRQLLVYDPSAERVQADKLLALVEAQSTHWDQVDEYLSLVLSNSCNSSEFILTRIKAEIEKHEKTAH
jgi:hypothetical protein